VSCISSILKWATFESLLEERPNGSTVIVLRSICTSAVIYGVALGLRNLIDPRNSWAFNLTELRRQVVETGTWLGPLLGASYASFYSRFSSQWSYLANLYNQIKQIECGSPTAQSVVDLKAAFIEDADELHLLRKPIFASTIRVWLTIDAVRQSFIDTAPGGKQRLEYLQGIIDDVYKTAAAEQTKRCPTRPQITLPDNLCRPLDHASEGRGSVKSG
jgi:hypothetical protein